MIKKASEDFTLSAYEEWSVLKEIECDLSLVTGLAAAFFILTLTFTLFLVLSGLLML